VLISSLIETWTQPVSYRSALQRHKYKYIIKLFTVIKKHDRWYIIITSSKYKPIYKVFLPEGFWGNVLCPIIKIPTSMRVKFEKVSALIDKLKRLVSRCACGIIFSGSCWHAPVNTIDRRCQSLNLHPHHRLTLEDDQCWQPQRACLVSIPLLAATSQKLVAGGGRGRGGTTRELVFQLTITVTATI